ncbi:MAG: hypothetical protein PHP45_03370 [Elusimicrobiales bacterium]|nr:hypothetical protein [Elusimicrobiales bacterium]
MKPNDRACDAAVMRRTRVDNPMTPEQVAYVWDHISKEQAAWLEKKPFWRQVAIVHILFERWKYHAKLHASREFRRLPEIFKDRPS